MYSASVAEQLEQILARLRQEHPLLWTLECERACTELMLSAGDMHALVNVSEAKEQFGLWFQGEDDEGGGSSSKTKKAKKKKKKKIRRKKGGTVKEKGSGSVLDEPSWIDDSGLLERNFVGARQGRGYDGVGFVG